MQRTFSILALIGGAAIIAVVLLAHRHFLTLPNREEIGPRTVGLRFEPVALDARRFAPLRLLGAWALSSDDPRIGGISGMAVDGDDLVALTDSGVVIRFPKPAGGLAEAQVRELPDGPSDARYKTSRDSEAIAHDPEGRGWWVAFETRNELWLYDPGFARAVRRVEIPPRGLTFNTGIEGMTAADGGLLLMPESGGRVLRLESSGWTDVPVAFPARRVSAAAALPDGSLLVIERRPIIIGFANALVRLDRCGRAYCLVWRKALAVGLFDNVEALAAEQFASGAIRLWLMTDDNMHRPLRTMLIAADLPPQP